MYFNQMLMGNWDWRFSCEIVNYLGMVKGRVWVGDPSTCPCTYISILALVLVPLGYFV